MKQVIFLGSGLARLLCSVYQQVIAPVTGDTAEYRPFIYRPATHDRAAIEAADLVVAQISSLQVRDAIVDIVGAGRCVLFPSVTAPFLWPFAGQVHPQIRSTWVRPDGPYPAALGDVWLNRTIDLGLDPDDAARSYIDLDVNTIVDLDRTLELTIAQQQERDKATGYSYAGIIIQTFRDACLFRSAELPSPAFARSICLDVFSRIDAEIAVRAKQQITALPFEAAALPIHPSVVQHFDLRFLQETSRYPFPNEGSFTFPDYVRHYLRCDWASEISEAIDRAGTGQPEQGIEKSLEGFARSPGSTVDLIALSRRLSEKGQTDDALATIQKALEIDPESVACRDRLSELLALQDRLAEAVDEMRRAVALHPEDPSRRARLCMLLLRAKRHDEAEAEIRRAIALAPRNGELYDRLGHVLNAQGRLLDCADAFRHASMLSPRHAPLHAHMSSILCQIGQFDEAEAVMHHAIALAPENESYQRALARLLESRPTKPFARSASTKEPACATSDHPVEARLHDGHKDSVSTNREPASSGDLYLHAS